VDCGFSAVASGNWAFQRAWAVRFFHNLERGFSAGQRVDARRHSSWSVMWRCQFRQDVNRRDRRLRRFFAIVARG